MNMPKIVGIYLAAGKSERMGFNKLSLPLGKEKLGSRALKTALHSTLDHIIVVTREDDLLEWVHPSLFLAPYAQRWSHLPCAESVQGQSSSIRGGIKKAIDLQADGAMIILADQPFLSRDIMDDILFLFREGQSYGFVAASYKEIPRPPILFSEREFRRLMKLQGDEGARKWLRTSGGFHGLIKEYTDYESFIDVDTKEEYWLIKMLCEEG